MRPWLIAVMTACSGGCVSGIPQRAETVVRAEGADGPSGSCDADRTGVAGACGPLGAGRFRFDTQVRIDEALAIELVFPVDAEGHVAPGAPFPVVVIVQGGLVTADRYRWLGEHFATRGYVCILPGHFADLAVFEADNARLALASVEREATKRNIIAGLVDPSSPAAVMGHSLGGVVATWQSLTSDRFSALGLLASYPADKDRVEQGTGVSVLSITGSNDAKTRVDAARAGLERFAPPRIFAVVDGMAHYDWTDGANASELKSGGAAERTQSETRRDAIFVIDTWLDATLRADAAAAERLGQDFPGVTVER